MCKGKTAGDWPIPYLAAAAVLVGSAWLDGRMAYRGQVRGETLDPSGYLWTGALVSLAVSAQIIVLTLATSRYWRMSRAVPWVYLFVGAGLLCFSPLLASNIPGLSAFLGSPALEPIREPLVRIGPRSALGVAAGAIAAIGLLGLVWPKRGYIGSAVPGGGGTSPR